MTFALFGILRSAEWKVRTELLGQSMGSIFKGQAVQKDLLELLDPSRRGG
jgi:hypothetical protein